MLLALRSLWEASEPTQTPAGKTYPYPFPGIGPFEPEQLSEEEAELMVIIGMEL